MRATPSTSPLLRVAGANERERRGLHHDAAAGARDTFGYILVGDVDHVRLTRRVEVGKMRLSAGCARAARGAGVPAAVRRCGSPPSCRSRACHVRVSVELRSCGGHLSI